MRIFPAILLTSFLISAAGTSSAEQYLVDIPHLCLKVDKVTEKGVELKTTTPDCQGFPSKIPIDFPMAMTQIEVVIDGVLYRKQAILQSEDMSRAVADVGAKADSFGGIKIDPVENEKIVKAREAAASAYAVTQTEEYKKKVEAYRETLQENLQAKLPEGFYLDSSKYSKKKQEEKKPGAPLLPAGDRIYIFISSSMPMSTVRAYAADLHRIAEPNASLYMRGALGDIAKMRPTISYIASVMRKDEGCDFTSGKCDMFGTEMTIDATLFRRYEIERVPAIVYVRNVSSHDPEWSEGDKANTKASPPVIVYGEISLAQALLEIQKTAQSPALESVIDKLLGSGRYL